MKALVTGAGGLLGGNLTRLLLQAGYEVRVLEHPGSSMEPFMDLAVELAKVDLTQDSEALEAAVSGVDYVFHCAAVTDLRASTKITWAVNYQATKLLLESCLSQNVKRLIFVGSGSSFAYGTLDNPGTETSGFPAKYRGIPYMESKFAAMELVRQYVDERGLDAVILAPSFMLGPLDYRPSSGELIQRFLSKGLRFVSPGGRNFVHVNDVAAAMVNAVEKGIKGETYLLAGENIRYLDFFSKVAVAAGVPAPIGTLPVPVIRLAGWLGSVFEKVTGRQVLLNSMIAGIACCKTYYSPAKAVRELGMPQTSIDIALKDSLDSLLQNGHLDPKYAPAAGRK